jgi:hypothetical protein
MRVPGLFLGHKHKNLSLHRNISDRKKDRHSAEVTIRSIMAQVCRNLPDNNFSDCTLAILERLKKEERDCGCLGGRRTWGFAAG